MSMVASAGGRDPRYQEADGQRVMKQSEITVRVVLGRGEASAMYGRATSRTTMSVSTPITGLDLRHERRGQQAHDARGGARRTTRTISPRYRAADRLEGIDCVQVAEEERPRGDRARVSRASHQPEGPAGHRRPETSHRAEYASVRRGTSCQQRAAHRRARNRQVFAHQSAAEQVLATRACA